MVKIPYKGEGNTSSPNTYGGIAICNNSFKALQKKAVKKS
jgi:hypothetical protein